MQIQTPIIILFLNKRGRGRGKNLSFSTYLTIQRRMVSLYALYLHIVIKVYNKKSTKTYLHQFYYAITKISFSQKKKQKQK